MKDFEQSQSIEHSLSIFVDLPQGPLTDYNDDVHCQHYEGSLNSYMSFQRNRLSIDSLSACSRQDFVNKAMLRSSPFAEISKIPDDICRSVNFLSSNSPDEIRTFWGRQLERLRSLVMLRRERSAAWYAQAPVELSRFHRRFPLDVWAALMHFCGLGGSDWLGQFVHGFPITGVLSQKFTFPLSSEKLATPLTVDKVLSSVKSRFAARAIRPPPLAMDLWQEAMDQVRQGWLDPPRLLSSAGQWADSPDSLINPAFRFAVAQSSKVRACDDLKDSLTNRLCVVETPITLPDWDLLAAISLLTSAHSKADWSFIKADDTSAYKNLPLKPSDSGLAAITLWDTSTRSWWALLSRTLLFGATASVLHYNVYSRIIAAFFNRLFGIPMVAFYDDLGSHMISELTQDALSLVKEASLLLGIILNEDKCDGGNPLSFLGLLGSFPDASNSWKLSISLTTEKVQRWSSQIELFLSEGKISFTELQKLIGKLSFAQSTVFGKCARAFIRPLYSWLYSAHFSAKISTEISEILRWWIRLLRSFRPRVVAFRRRFPEYIIFTDASYKNGVGKIAAFLFKREDFLNDQTVSHVASCVFPAHMLEFFIDTLPIFALEFFVIALAVFEWKDILRGATATLYTDNTGAFGAVLNTGSSAHSVSSITMCLWYLIAQIDLSLWLEAVSSPLNIADLPTRDKPSPFRSVKTTNFTLINEAFLFYTKLSVPEVLNFRYETG